MQGPTAPVCYHKKRISPFFMLTYRIAAEVNICNSARTWDGPRTVQNSMLLACWSNLTTRKESRVAQLGRPFSTPNSCPLLAVVWCWRGGKSRIAGRNTRSLVAILQKWFAYARLLSRHGCTTTLFRILFPTVKIVCKDTISSPRSSCRSPQHFSSSTQCTRWMVGNLSVELVCRVLCRVKNASRTACFASWELWYSHLVAVNLKMGRKLKCGRTCHRPLLPYTSDGKLKMRRSTEVYHHVPGFCGRLQTIARRPKVETPNHVWTHVGMGRWNCRVPV